MALHVFEVIYAGVSAPENHSTVGVGLFRPYGVCVRQSSSSEELPVGKNISRGSFFSNKAEKPDEVVGTNALKFMLGVKGLSAAYLPWHGSRLRIYQVSLTLGNSKPEPSTIVRRMDAAAYWYSIMAATAQL